MNQTHYFARAFQWTAVGAAVLLAFAFEWLSPVYALIALMLGHLFLGTFKRPQPWTLLLLAWYLWQVTSISWSARTAEGWENVLRLLPLALLPALGRLAPVRFDRARLWNAFALAVVVSWTFVFFQTLINDGWAGYKNFFLQSRLSLHYQSFYLLIAAIILENRAWKLPPWLRWMSIAGIAWLLLGILLLSARIHLLLVAFVILWRSVELWKAHPAWRPVLARATAGILAVSFAAMLLLPTPRSRMLDLVNELRSVRTMVDGKQTNHRVFIWRSGWDVIEQHLWSGAGSGGAEYELNQLLQQCDAPFYRGTERYFLYEQDYNYHNIYLQSWAQGGLVQLLLWLALLIWTVRRQRGWARLATVVFALMGLTESLLERQAGVLFLALLWWGSWQEDPPVDAE